MNLEQKLESWKQVGLLEASQAKAILQHENDIEKSNFALYGFMGLGASVVILGIISIIAANWEAIGSNTKLMTYFALQFGLGLAYLRLPSSRNLLKETCLYLFAIGLFAGIALIAQIFNLSGAFWKPFAFWLLLTMGTVFLAQKRLLVHLWWAIFLVTFPQALIDIWGFNDFLEFSLMCLSISFWMVILGLEGENILPKLPPAFTELALKYGFFALLFFGSIGGTFLWYFGETHPWIKQPILSTSLKWSMGFLYISALLTFLSAYHRSPALNNNLKRMIAAMFIILCLFNTLPIYFSLYGKIGGAFFFIILWICVAWTTALLPSKRLYNLATLIIMLRFIAIYLEVFGDLINTGIGLIISGLLLLLAAFAWYRYRHKLLSWIQP